MNKITIENYKGFDIEFNIDYEKFQCVVAEDNTKESKSFSAVKKFIDEYKKSNQDFKPFYVEANPDEYYGRRDTLKIIGIRKDDRFVYEKDGSKNQLADIYLSNYILKKDENQKILSELGELEDELNAYQRKCLSAKEELLAKLNIVTLKDHKKTLL